MNRAERRHAEKLRARRQKPLQRVGMRDINWMKNLGLKPNTPRMHATMAVLIADGKLDGYKSIGLDQFKEEHL